MTLVARIIDPNIDIPWIQVGEMAQAAGTNLFITERGQLVTAPRGLPGWQRIAIKIKSAHHAIVEAQQCAA